MAYLYHLTNGQGDYTHTTLEMYRDILVENGWKLEPKLESWEQGRTIHNAVNYIPIYEVVKNIRNNIKMNTKTIKSKLDKISVNEKYYKDLIDEHWGYGQTIGQDMMRRNEIMQEFIEDGLYDDYTESWNDEKMSSQLREYIKEKFGY